MLCRVALGTQMVKQRINSEVQIKVPLKPMNNPQGVSPNKGKQGTTRGKEKIPWPRWESNIHMYFLFAAIYHPKSSPTFSVRPRSSVGRVTVDLIRKSWVRFPPRSKDFLPAPRGSPPPPIRANALWAIHGFKQHFNSHLRVNSLFHHSYTVLRWRLWRHGNTIHATIHLNKAEYSYFLVKVSEVKSIYLVKSDNKFFAPLHNSVILRSEAYTVYVIT